MMRSTGEVVRELKTSPPPEGERDRAGLMTPARRNSLEARNPGRA
jgi:hypothetical protein